MKMPRTCVLSEAYDAKTKNTAATAYGGTVKSWALTLANNKSIICYLETRFETHSIQMI